MYEYESYQCAEGTVNIYFDELAESPRDWDCNVWRLISNHRDIHLNEAGISLDELAEDKWIQANYLVRPVYMYQHIGVALSLRPFLNLFDSGVGFFAVLDKKRYCRERGKKIFTKKLKEQAMTQLAAEVETYSAYLNGDVYCFEVVDKDGEIVDSCGGFIGDSGLEAIKAEYPEIVETAEAI